MWNHSAEMHEAMASKSIVPPKLSSQDVADLMIYLRSLPVLRSRSASFGMGEPDQGRVVFERSCESCHSFGPGIGKQVDLLQRRGPQTVTGYIAAMWNHSDGMRARGPRVSVTPQNSQFPKLEPEDMRHLIAFLFSQFYFFERGDAARGRRVFENKSCASCHETPGKEPGAPDLTQAAELYSPITLTSAAWRHGRSMSDVMKRKGILWPQFQGPEMADLIAYLNSRVVIRVANPAAN
jgi:mono/diheme cytochrome c family protein